MQFYAPWGKRRQVRSKLELKQMELDGKDEIIELKDAVIASLKEHQTESDRIRDKRQKLAEKMADEYIEADEKGLIDKIPKKYGGKGWSGIIATTLKSIPDDKIPGLNAGTKGMIGSLVEDNKEIVEELAPLLMGTLFQNLPEETKNGLMKFLAPGAKEKGK